MDALGDGEIRLTEVVVDWVALADTAAGEVVSEERTSTREDTGAVSLIAIVIIRTHRHTIPRDIISKRQWRFRAQLHTGITRMIPIISTRTHGHAIPRTAIDMLEVGSRPGGTEKHTFHSGRVIEIGRRASAHADVVVVIGVVGGAVVDAVSRGVVGVGCVAALGSAETCEVVFVVA